MIRYSDNNAILPAMPRQTSFADLDYSHKKRQTRREVFLNEMEVVVPWPALLSRIEPHYPRSGRRGRQPMGLASMFRIYCMQNWFNLSDRQMEDALYEIESMRRFAGFGGVTDALPDETTILNFRHLLEKYNLTVVLLEEINVFASRIKDCWYPRAPWWTPASSMRRVRPRTRRRGATRKCIRPARASSGTLA